MSYYVHTRHPFQLVPDEPSPVRRNRLIGGLPVGQWDHPQITQTLTKNAIEPKEPLDPAQVRARSIVVKRELRSLEAKRMQVDDENGLTFDFALDALRLQRKILAHRTASDLERLPVELTKWIFELCCINPEAYANHNLQRTRISSVCRYWRQVALQDPLLWRTLWFSGHYPWKSTVLALSRTGDAQLDVRISDPIKYRNDPEQPPKLTVLQLGHLMHMLLPHVHRISPPRVKISSCSNISPPNSIRSRIQNPRTGKILIGIDEKKGRSKGLDGLEPP